MANLDSILKNREISLPTKVHLVKAMVFPVVTYGCESWTIKKAEHRRTDAFELWCWRRLLRIPWRAGRSNQYILKKISPECSRKDWCWSWNSNTLATWCKELTHLKMPWCKERLKAGGEVDDRRWDGWMASPTRWTWVWASSGSQWWTGKPGMLQSIRSQRVGHDWVTELNWKNPPANAGNVRDTSLIPELGRSSGGGYGNPLQYSCLENSMNRRAWQATVHRIAKSQTQLKRLSAHA